MAGWSPYKRPWKKTPPVITTPYANANANKNRVLTSTGKQGPGGPVASKGGYQYTNYLRAGLANQATKPGGGSTWWTSNLTPGQLQDLTLDPNKFKEVSNAFNYMGGTPPPGQMPGYPGSGGGGYGGGGGGGGGGGPAGMSQEMFDYLASIMGKSKPQDVAYNPVDLAEPTWDPSQYGVARQGVTSGIQGIRDRGMAAFGRARTELGQYQNPFEGGLRTNNPDLQNAMQRMMAANGVNPGQVGATNAEGVQADQAMRNSLAMLAGVSQNQAAGNLRALGGDEQTFDQTLGLEGNNLNLGINMAEARGKTAWQDKVDAIRQQEAMANWQRQNAVGDTNAQQQNAWNADILKTYLQLVGGTAPGVTLPANGSLPWAV